jgi:hypothetical protein
MRFVRAFILSCACSAAASALAVLIAPRWGWNHSFAPTGVGTVIVYTLFNAIVVLVLHTPLLLGLKWATRNRVKLSPWAWSALGLTIPLLVYLAFMVADILQSGYEKAGQNFWERAWLGLNPEMLVFSSLMPTMIGGAAFGWLLFKPVSYAA